MATESVYSSALGQTVKLGRIRPAALPQIPELRHYFFPTGKPLPEKVDYYTKAMPSIKRMYLNNRYGDCVVAGKYHQVGVWSAADSPDVIVGTDDEVLSMYRKICGPGDNGCIITRVLDYQRNNGLPFNGKLHKIDAYLAVNMRNKELLKAAIYFFGSVTFGINLPGAWANSPDGGLWDVTNSGSVGGHDVCAVGYDSTGVQISTWGGLRTITWAALANNRWVEECYVSLSPNWYNDDRLSPGGINVEQLRIDLDKLGGGTVPDLPDVPPTPPTPPTPPAPTPPKPSLWSVIFSTLMAGLVARKPFNQIIADIELAVIQWFLKMQREGQWPTSSST